MLTIAVTGATGFVGDFIAQYLEAKGCRVLRFGRKDIPGVRRWNIEQEAYTAPAGVDGVVHCAALVDDWAAYADAYAANVIGTRNVIKTFSESSVFVHISSTSIYDAQCACPVIAEDDCVGGKLLNNYSKTKLLAERELLPSDIPSRIILRPHAIYGPGDTTLAPRIKNAIRFGYFPLPGNGKNRLSFTHVENLAQAVWLALATAKRGLGVYNITDGEPVVMSEALAAVQKLNKLHFKIFRLPRTLCRAIGFVLESVYRLCGLKKPPPLTRYIVNQLAGDHVYDIAKACRELGYQPVRNVHTDFLL